MGAWWLLGSPADPNKQCARRPLPQTAHDRPTDRPPPPPPLPPLARRYHRGFYKNRAIALQRWRSTWEQRLARREERDTRIRRAGERLQRRVSWGAWQDWKAHQKALAEA